ncbi:MAG: phenylalanine--tRNA ligase subunit beta [Erysipelotrichaceae bacterium]|nr:phenylalanine--tRNA ligase subunit beta [Erysipelotrichaceae bacterium]
MKLSLKWLSQLVDLEGLTEEEIVNRTIKAGFEIEEITRMGVGTKLVVGKVIECHDHPDSDHLHVTKTDIGSEVLDIVCGAPNCREGLKVIVAQVGSELPGGTIKAGKIRGEVSNGMLCSLLELGVPKELLPDDSPSQNGIEELDDRFEVGETDILKKLGYEDSILEVEIYANRPDCLSMYGMAKEMGAILDRKCVLPEFDGAAAVGGPSTLKVASRSANCPHYMAKVVNHVKLGPSPEWMRQLLRSNGVKSINNVVDISNLVMLETGQPLHFFDLRSNPNRNITVVDDYEGAYTALDGISYDLKKGDILITSDEQPIAIGGIMGGDGSKILDDTTGIIIESALFNYAQIRRTANRLGLQTEAAMRFAKGLDPLAQQKAMDRAVQLLKEYAEADGFEETVEAGKCDYEPHEVRETLAHLNALIGKEYAQEEVLSVLRRLDFDPYVEGEEIVARIPSWRSDDIRLREDIDEEVIRLTDFDDLAATLPVMPQTIGRLSRKQALRRVIRTYLSQHGLHETVSYTLTDEAGIRNSIRPLGETIALASPLSDARKYIRVSLFSNMMETLKYNLDHGMNNVNIFELSSLYAAGDKHDERLAIALCGTPESKRIGRETAKSDFYSLKGLLCDLLDELGYGKKRIHLEELEDEPLMHPYRSAKIQIDRQEVGILGQVHPGFAGKQKLGEVYYLELSLDQLMNKQAAVTKAPVIRRFPAISRDISVLVDKAVKVEDLMKTIKKSGGNLVDSVEVFDVYEGKGIDDNMRSLSFTIRFLDPERTLKTEEVQPLYDKILADLEKQYHTTQR